LSFGPIAAPARRPDSVAAAADPVKLRKLRRDSADMLASPPEYYFVVTMMRLTPELRKHSAFVLRCVPGTKRMQALLASPRWMP
jgi:hypothetical protein